MTKTILITGANGEIGHGLIKKLAEDSQNKIVALDINSLDPDLSKLTLQFVKADILDNRLLDELFKKYHFDTIFHLAALLSTSSERDPVKAHHVNTDGAINILAIAEKFARANTKKVKFIFPSSIAIYGLPNLEVKKRVGKIKEEQYNLPATMYGCNKLYIELLGNYYARYYEKHKKSEQYLDFRAIRFPGIISADTLPTGGTSDFGPEMLHAAAQNKPYACFVRADSKIPFMVMPDAVKVLLKLAKAPSSSVKHHVYNVGSFSISAGEIAKYAHEINKIKITYKPHQKRQAIVDSWPEDVDDSEARADWGWKPSCDKTKAFEEYLIPAIKARYG
ncbi:epimerase [Candidatus Woesebacteria bacterium RIFCSPHIGHO2_01_FULL_44_21]|uniref:Epimerase n=1 Tax=Candidatus Woesebacteria bacterium RIFCSPHIGHO2_01_FULL_44_21 TaxID=1802503 RepID=A0A1F7YWN2_9BACT|nr:MAG: epimerase [Candidatus Woesebacteria bacterium RIFCSPHIGHO2_01_FULL_44_21]OGM71361.1 MAG: epimerase [Candidatus Woesebacteria bacterium RIFCSPLOWO2_01_FULL_44_24b]